MSEQAEQISGEEPGSLSAGNPHSVPNATETAAVAATTSEAHAAEAPKAEVNAAASEPEASQPEMPQLAGKVIVMSRGDRAWADNGAHSGPEENLGVSGKRRITAMAAVVALATAAGVLGGALATSAFTRGSSSDVATNGSQNSFEASLSRIDADIQVLKSGLDHTSKLGMSQFNKTSERLDKIERAQADPSAKIARLSEAVDKLRAAPAATPAVAAAAPAVAKESPKESIKETTGSISAPPNASAAQQAAATPPKPEVGRLPTVDGWVLRDVAQGGALIDSRRGVYEVYAGDFIPGLGRIDAIRRQDGRWVVVTSKGLIVAR